METTERIPTKKEIKMLSGTFNNISVISVTFDLKSIYLSKPIVCASGRTNRLINNMCIRVENGRISNVEQDKPATHVIIKLKGLVSSQFTIFVQEILGTGIEMIKI